MLVIRRERNCFADKSIRVIGRYEFGGTLGRSDPFGDDVMAFSADRRISAVQIQPIPTFCLIKIAEYQVMCIVVCAGTARLIRSFRNRLYRIFQDANHLNFFVCNGTAGL